MSEFARTIIQSFHEFVVSNCSSDGQKECGNDCRNERMDDDVVVGFCSKSGIQLFIMQMAKDIEGNTRLN